MFTFPVRGVFFEQRSSNESMSSLSPPAAADEEDSVIGSVLAAGSVVTSPTLDDIKSVWQFEKVKKLGGKDNSAKRWHCGWCNTTLMGWHVQYADFQGQKKES